MADLTGRPAPLGVAAELWDILACPCDAHGAVRPDEEHRRIVCTVCGRSYEVRDGIPVMLLDEAILPPGGVQGDLLAGE